MMIRLAKKEDIKQLIPLVMIILHDMELPLLQKMSEHEVARLLEEASQDETYRYSFKRALVLEKDGVIEGVAYSYPAKDEEKIDEAWEKLLATNEPLFKDKETMGDEWYLDSLAVRKEARGRGYGTQLLEAVYQLAYENHAPCVGLNVDKENTKAARLYHHLGFKKVGETMLSSHHYDHLQKEIAYN